MPIDHEEREQALEAAEELLLAKYSGGRAWLDPVHALHAVRAAAHGHDVDGRETPEVSAEDLLAALTRLDEARAALDTLERDLTRAARARKASWQDIAGALGLASRSSAESRHTRLERSATTYRADRHPEHRRVERARERAADTWCRENEDRLRVAALRLADAAPSWPQLARATDDGRRLATAAAELDGPALADRLRRLQLILDARHTDLPTGDAATARTEALALMDELRTVRHSLPHPGAERPGHAR
ncbi:hypothetical protein CTZ27_36280 [Streptomyces griseocarneus]|nr:hypothetical protein CTZ27_36280 [Streptomyces griseocarneus]